MLQYEQFFGNVQQHSKPTQDRDCQPKTDRGPMIPFYIMHKKRGTKPLWMTKEPGQEEKKIRFTNGRVSRKELKVKCNVCGVQGHKIRNHEVKIFSNRNNSQIVLINFSIFEFFFASVFKSQISSIPRKGKAWHMTTGPVAKPIM